MFSSNVQTAQTTQVQMVVCVCQTFTISCLCCFFLKHTKFQHSNNSNVCCSSKRFKCSKCPTCQSVIISNCQTVQISRCHIVIVNKNVRCFMILKFSNFNCSCGFPTCSNNQKLVVLLCVVYFHQMILLLCSKHTSKVQKFKIAKVRHSKSYGFQN